jgi:proteic killer suppression protein
VDGVAEHPVLNPDTTLVIAETAVSLVLLRGRALGRIDRLQRHMSATGKAPTQRRKRRSNRPSSRCVCVDKRQLTFYSWTMIESFKHKGLRSLFEQDDARRVGADQVDRLRLILSALDQAGEVRDMNQPTFRLHQLKGNRKGAWAVTVRANWRVTFLFEGGDAYDVDLEDYH